MKLLSAILSGILAVSAAAADTAGGIDLVDQCGDEIALKADGLDQHVFARLHGAGVGYDVVGKGQQACVLHGKFLLWKDQ